MSEPDDYTWDQLESIFHDALQIPVNERRTFVDRETAGNTRLRDEVIALLDGHDQVGDEFLSPAEQPGHHAESLTDGEHPLVGRTIGDFTLTRLLAVGGMGAVFEATQAHPRRSVAIKVLRLGVASHSSLRRFQYESEILARLHHPGIAQIFEAGTFDDGGGGVPYFAMELLAGARPLDEYAREERLDRDEALALFLEVCDAVQHGHQHGIVHRDLKPANVLVDAEGRPKVIDFGIARSTDSDVTRASMQTDVGQIVGTLPYMSPEQTLADPSALDVRSDVYSLGVMLYQLMTGHLPLSVGERPITEAIRIIRQDRPARPSATHPAMQGDLDTILMKALEKEPSRRYQSVYELASDIRRYLAHEPISARPASVTYQLRLFARRHRGLVAGAGVIALMLIASTIVCVVYAIDAHRHARAETEQRLVAEQVTSFLHSMLSAARPSMSLDQDMTVMEVLDAAAARVEVDLADNAEALSDVLITLGATYQRVGQNQKSLEFLERAVALRESLGRPNDIRLAVARHELGWTHSHLGDRKTAQRHLTLAREEMIAAGAGESIHMAEVLHRLGTAYGHDAQYELAEATLIEAVQMAERVHGGPTTSTVIINTALCHVLHTQRRLEEAETIYVETINLAREILPAVHPELATILNGHASNLFVQSKVPEAAAAWRESLEILEQILPEDHPDLAAVMQNLALTHERMLEYDEAERLLKEAIRLRRAALGDAHPRVARTLSRLGWLSLARNDVSGAVVTMEEAVATQRAALEATDRDGDSELAEHLGGLAFALRAHDRAAEAIPFLREAHEIQLAVLPEDDHRIAQTLSIMGVTLIELGQAAEAESILREAIRIRELRLPGHWLIANTESVLGQCLTALERFDEAERILLRADEALRPVLGDQHPRTRESAQRLVDLYTATGDAAAVTAWSGRLEQ